jgi:hypothetical protein
LGGKLTLPSLIRIAKSRAWLSLDMQVFTCIFIFSHSSETDAR